MHEAPIRFALLCVCVGPFGTPGFGSDGPPRAGRFPLASPACVETRATNRALFEAPAIVSKIGKWKTGKTKRPRILEELFAHAAAAFQPDSWTHFNPQKSIMNIETLSLFASKHIWYEYHITTLVHSRMPEMIVHFGSSFSGANIQPITLAVCVIELTRFPCSFHAGRPTQARRPSICIFEKQSVTAADSELAKPHQPRVGVDMLFLPPEGRGGPCRSPR